MKLQQLYLIIGLSIILIGCESSVKKKPSGLSLMKFGIPITLNAPDDAVVSQGSSGRMSTDVNVKSGEDFHLHVFMTSALSSDLQAIKLGYKDDVISNPYFIKMLEEFDDGFIFEINSVNGFDKKYDFRRIILQGDKEIIFQSGVTGEFDEKAVKKMYHSLIR
jgi:hypothetical protein